MSDRYTATIDILKRDIEAYPRLKEEVQLTFYDSDNNLWDKDNWDDDGVVAHFKDDQASYGEFPELEKLLIELRVPFDRWSEAYIEGPVYASYRPDLDPRGPYYLDGTVYDCMYSGSELKKLADGLNFNDLSDITTLGTRFMEFLYRIPDIRPLTEYADRERSA